MINEFGINHYAGNVQYHITGFLDKNRDMFSTDFKQLIVASANKFLKGLFSEKELQIKSDSSRRSATLTMKFKESLESLLNTLQKCNPFFVRCIKPNDSQSSKVHFLFLLFALLSNASMGIKFCAKINNFTLLKGF